ncbi:hypothetical protein AB0K80_32230 [Streptomyces sp. NPDC052682]|uniref:hypothetical protein n=1 Tax=Streptomyces sp. NPDC052682 TaxID=3154954 RepID=UPI0034397D84
MFPARVRAGVPSALVMLALSGCSSPWGCTDTAAERGEAGARVQVVDTYGKPLGVTAEIVDWRLEPHPQVPDEGDQVSFRYRFDGADTTSSGPAVDACAVDKQRVALGCRTLYAAWAFGPNGDPTGHDWLAVEHPERVAGVLVIPNDQSYRGRSCEVDIKDGGGMHPPDPAGIGDQL